MGHAWAMKGLGDGVETVGGVVVESVHEVPCERWGALVGVFGLVDGQRWLRWCSLRLAASGSYSTRCFNDHKTRTQPPRSP
ncbi:MAG: hypothetical protein ACXW1Y_13400 [Acidimicrobiia bacterium]